MTSLLTRVLCLSLVAAAPALAVAGGTASSSGGSRPAAAATDKLDPNDTDTVIKVAGQLIDDSNRDKDFPSCQIGWEMESSSVAFTIISGHYLIDTPFRVTDDLTPAECVKECRRDPDCKSLNIDYRRGTCEYANTRMRSPPVLLPPPAGTSSSSADQLRVTNRNLRPSSGQNYFEKLCLPHKSVARLCPDRDWLFERVQGVSLRGLPDGHKERVPGARTRESCLFHCLNLTSATAGPMVQPSNSSSRTPLTVCRSAEFNSLTNECMISSFNRFSSNDARIFLDKDSNVDYFESNCAPDAKGFCNTKGVKEQRQLLTEKILISNSIEDCQSECMSDLNIGFICRSFTYEASTRTCSLSHHSSKSSPIVKSATHVYFEISSCFELEVDCDPTLMKVSVHSNMLFNGRVYVRDRPKSCFIDVQNAMDFAFPIQLQGKECGTTRESEGDFSTVLVIQGNDQVVTALDKAIGVRCSFPVGNKTLRGETSLRINEIAFLPEKKIKASAKLPDVSLRITDARGLEKDLFTIGEPLKVQVRMSDESVYGIFVRNIVARNGRLGEGRSADGNESSLVLIDKSGCPGEGRMMREVRLIDDSTKSLESVFEAFAFTGSNVLQLEAEVETCLDRCQAVRCQQSSIRSEDGEDSMSYGRRRRRRDAGSLHEQTVEIKTRDGILVHSGDVLRKQTIAKQIKIRDPERERPSSTKAKVTRRLEDPGTPALGRRTSSSSLSSSSSRVGDNSLNRGTLMLFVMTFFVIYLIFLATGILYLRHRHSTLATQSYY